MSVMSSFRYNGDCAEEDLEISQSDYFQHGQRTDEGLAAIQFGPLFSVSITTTITINNSNTTVSILITITIIIIIIINIFGPLSECYL